MPLDHLLDVVSESDLTLREGVPAGEVHAQGLLHRAAHVLVVNAAGKICVHLKSKTRPIHPGLWSTSIWEDVRSRETYEHTARHALQEYLGLDCALTELGRAHVRDEYGNELVCVYTTRADRIPRRDARFLEKEAFMTTREIRDLIERGKATPHLAKAIALYMGTQITGGVARI